MRYRSSYLMLYFCCGCIGSSIWMVSGFGCGMAAMDILYVSCLGFCLFCSFSRGIAFLILPYHWVSGTGLVCACISLQICSTMWEHIILFLLCAGICHCEYMVDVILIWCWSVVSSVFAAGLFYLRKDSLHVFMSRFLCGEAL